MLGDHALAKAERVPAIHSSFPARSHHCLRAVLIEAARPPSGTAAERDGGRKSNPAPSTAPADPREQGYGAGERPWRRRQLGPCQAHYQRRSIDISSNRAAKQRMSFALRSSRTIASVKTGVVPSLGA
jgi:hypothetical protein